MEDRTTLSNWRFKKAEQCLITAKSNLEINDYSGATNRSYYCVFHCIRSILALEGIDFKKHTAVISYFREHYVKPGIFDKRMSDIIGSLFILRSECDYDDFFIISKEEITHQVENASYFMENTRDFLNRKT